MWDRRISHGSSSTGRMAAANQLSHKVADWRSRISRAAASPPAAPTSPRLPQALACSSSTSSPAVRPQPRYSASRSSSSCRSTVSCRASSATHSSLPLHPSAAHTADPASLQTPGTVSPAAASLSVGQVVEVECERLGTAGVGVCLWGPSRLVLLVQGALPGERLTAVITAVKKSECAGRFGWVGGWGDLDTQMHIKAEHGLWQPLNGELSWPAWARARGDIGYSSRALWYEGVMAVSSTCACYTPTSARCHLPFQIVLRYCLIPFIYEKPPQH